MHLDTLRYRLGRLEELVGASLRDRSWRAGSGGRSSVRRCAPEPFWSELQVRGRLIWWPVPSGAAVGRGHWFSHTDWEERMNDYLALS